MTARLVLDHVAIGYDGDVFLHGLCLEVEPAEIIALVGPSGSGKSTLLSTIVGIVPCYSGAVYIDGIDMTTAPVNERRVGMVFQDPLLFPHLSVIDNVAYGLRRKGLGRQQARDQALDLLNWVGLADLAARMPHQLSGGQAQRVALVRALAPEPSVLLLDEPFSALDIDLRQRLASEVSELLRTRGVAAVHVTHDLDEANRIADRIVALADLVQS